MSNPYHSHFLKLSAVLALLLLLGACQTFDTSKQAWPNDLPSRSSFVRAYNKQVAAGTVQTSLDEHLSWVLKFYQGSVLYPTGWNDMIDLVVNSFERKRDKRVAGKRLRKLGQKICIEWAQSNSARNINSSNIATWGTALRSSVQHTEQFEFMAKVEDDVQNLVDRKIMSHEITRDRYYPLEDYDNF